MYLRDVAAVAAVVAVVAVLLHAPNDRVSATFISEGEPVSTASLEIADTAEERRRGLMGREELCSSCGMVFVYPSSGERVFWMKNTSIGLDIMFLSEEGKILGIETAEPPEPGTPDKELERYRSDVPARYVIELPMGYAARNGVEPGDTVEFEPGLESTYQP